MKVCKIEGCERRMISRGWCSLHYQRHRKHGDPLVGPRPRRFQTDPTCSIEGCEGHTYMARLCCAHYMRKKRYGDPLGGSATMQGAPANFLREEVLTYTGDKCLEWPYGRSGGYASLRLSGMTSACRVVCEVTHGPPPSPTHQAAHSCGRGDKGCVTPAHLRWATPQENSDEKVMHGTVYKGEDQWNSKLTEDEVHEIRRLKGKKTQKEIGEMFGVWHSTISLIHSRKQWGWLPDKPEEEETPEVPYLQDVPS